ncbi:efflux RND transporter periplasmic adaptor subunit [Pseudoalteromonas peptidolytica]|uniref:efflux RND transporter periplasmic adaptor subunit n=1 Tax=Pseudoalteromonas peptidolytica TaxID=61150 RepID=UPI00298E3BAE|nr:biotin/lipoyl-binding protein [Pseudoalteromonas peptidolytica]MDW7550152.1 efflux RND transporter periplasmic adaptor subunit [Pseudoalteromonas peptidolytica]
MDIKISRNKSSRQSPIWRWLGITLSVFVALSFLLSQEHNQLDANTITFAPIQKSSIQYSVSGYGKLRSKLSREITTTFSAEVSTVEYLAGTKVEPDTVIMRLINPELTQRLQRERLTLARQRASVDALKLSQQSELLTLQGQIALLHSECESAKLREQAERLLVKQGIVSELDHKRSVLTLEQLKTRVLLSEQQLTQMQALHIRSIEIERELLKEYELSHDIAKQAVEQLNVKAGIAGMLQAVNVSQGQAITPGQTLAVVGSERLLVADLLVPEREASEVVIGQPAMINTFVGKVAATVSRVVPVVQDGRIAIELALTGTLPSNARPALTIEGKIFTARIQDALSIPQLPWLSPQSNSDLFVLDKQENVLIKKSFKFGKLAGNAIEILEGGSAGEQVVMSDMSAHQHLKKITITSLNR